MERPLLTTECKRVYATFAVTGSLWYCGHRINHGHVVGRIHAVSIGLADH